jgi:hypothetical protein
MKPSLTVEVRAVRRATGWTAGIRFLAGAKDSSLLHSIQTDSGVYLASCLMGARGALCGGEADHSPPSGAKVKNGGAVPPLPLTSSWHGA